MKITIALIPIIILSFLSIIFGNEFMAVPIVDEIFKDETMWGLIYPNETLPEKNVMFSIHELQGAIVILIAITVGIAFVGIKVLGSGLSDPSVRVIITATVYTGLWLVLSVLASSLIFSIEIFGNIIYVILTIIYVIGVIEKISEG